MMQYSLKNLSTNSKLTLLAIADGIRMHLVDLACQLKQGNSFHAFEANLKLFDLKILNLKPALEEHKKFKFVYQQIDGYLKLSKREYPVHFENLAGQLKSLFWVENKNGEVFDIQKIREDRSFDLKHLTEKISEIITEGGAAYAGRQEHMILSEARHMVSPFELAKLYMGFSENGPVDLTEEAVWIADYLRDKKYFFEAGLLYSDLFYLTRSHEMLTQLAGCSLLLTRDQLWEQSLILNQLILETNHPEVTKMIGHAAKRFEAAHQLDFTFVQYTDLYERAQKYDEKRVLKNQASSILPFVADPKNKYRFLILMAEEGNSVAKFRVDNYFEDWLANKDFGEFYYLCKLLAGSDPLFEKSIEGAEILKQNGFFDQALILYGLLYLNKKISIKKFYAEFLGAKERALKTISEFNILSRVLGTLQLEIKELSQLKQYNSPHD